MFDLDDEQSPPGPTEVMRRTAFADAPSPVDLGPLFAQSRRASADPDEDGTTPTLELPPSRPYRAVPRTGPDPYSAHGRRSFAPPPPGLRRSLPPPPPRVRPSLPPVPPPFETVAFAPPAVAAPPTTDVATPSIAPISVDLLPPSPDDTMEVAPVAADLVGGVLIADVVPPSRIPTVRPLHSAPRLAEELPTSRTARKSNVVLSVLLGAAGICFVGVAMVAASVVLRSRAAGAPPAAEPAKAAAVPILVDDLPDNGSVGISPHALPDARRAAPALAAAPARTSIAPVVASPSEPEPEPEPAPTPTTQAAGQTGRIMVSGTSISVIVDGETVPVEYGKVTVACGRHQVSTASSTSVVDVPCGGSVTAE